MSVVVSALYKWEAEVVDTNGFCHTLHVKNYNVIVYTSINEFVIVFFLMVI